MERTIVIKICLSLSEGFGVILKRFQVVSDSRAKEMSELTKSLNPAVPKILIFRGSLQGEAGRGAHFDLVHGIFH